MEKLRQNDYSRVRDRCTKETRYTVDKDRSYLYPHPGCAYLDKGKCTLKACVRKEGK